MIGLFLLLTVVWGSAYQVNIQTKQSAIDEAAARAKRLTVFFSSSVESTLSYADDYIKTLRRNYLKEHSLEAIRQHLKAIPPNKNILSHITLMNANGVPVLISDGRKERKAKPGTHARDRGYFKFQRSNAQDSVFISLARKGRNTGLVTVRLVRRITDNDGKFLGVIFAAIKETQLLEFFNTTRMGPNSSATLVGLDMRIRLRKSHRGLDGIGKNISKSKLWMHLKKSPAGLYRQTSIVDGIPRLWTYQRLANFPLVSVIGTARPDVLQTTVASIRNTYGISALISLIAIILVILAFREIAASKRIAREAAELRRTEQELKARNELLQRLDAALQEAEAANRAKSDFLSSMSHELRTPLNAVLGFAQLMSLNPKEPLTDKQKDAVKMITNGGQHLLDLINQVLELSKIEAGKLDLSIESFSPKPVLEESFALANKMAEPRSISVNNLSSEKSLPLIRADLTRVKQVMLNLLSNAVKYNRDGGSITIDAEQTDGQTLRISIRDTGQGISDKDQKRVFEPFERLSRNNAETEGTGIGLTISKQLIELMGGTVGFDSKLNEGSVFWVELPIGDAPSPSDNQTRLDQIEKAGQIESSPSGRTHRILYVEDNETNVELMKSIFDVHDSIELLIAPDGEQGIDMAMSLQPDLILMDIGLPGIDGIHATQALKQMSATKDILVVAITAAAMKHEVERAKDAGFAAYLTKPIDVPETLRVIQKYLASDNPSEPNTPSE